MKRVLTLILAMAMLFAFTACGGDGSASVVPSSASQPAASASVPEPEPEPEPVFAMGPLRMPQKWGHASEGIGLGLDISPLTDENSILLRMDYETLKQEPFCAIEGCRHNSESCAAYKARESAFSEVNSMANGYFVMHDELIILRQYEPTRKEHATFTLERMNAEGTAREVFVEIPGKLYAGDGSDFVTDDKWLFLDVYNYGEDIDSPQLQLEAEGSCLLRIDLETGDVESMRDMKDRALFGFDGDALLMWNFEVEPAETVAWRPQFDEEIELPQIPDALNGDDFNRENVFYGGVSYYVRTPEGENARLLGWRPTTGEVTLDVELPGDDCRFVTVSDGYLEAKDGDGYYFVRLSDGEIISPPLLAEGGEGSPAHIEAVLDGYYIVTSAYQMRTVNNFGMLLPMRESVFAKISIDDYWAGQANYTLVEMWRG